MFLVTPTPIVFHSGVSMFSRCPEESIHMCNINLASPFSDSEGRFFRLPPSCGADLGRLLRMAEAGHSHRRDDFWPGPVAGCHGEALAQPLMSARDGPSEPADMSVGGYPSNALARI